LHPVRDNALTCINGPASMMQAQRSDRRRSRRAGQINKKLATASVSN